MQKLEKVLEEIDLVKEEIVNLDCGGDYNAGLRDMAMMAKQIIRKYMNDDWISADEKPKKDYTTVFAVDKHDYYFVAVYDKEHGYRTNDVGADVDNIVAYCLFNLYRPERSDNHD